MRHDLQHVNASFVKVVGQKMDVRDQAVLVAGDIKHCDRVFGAAGLHEIHPLSEGVLHLGHCPPGGLPHAGLREDLPHHFTPIHRRALIAAVVQVRELEMVQTHQGEDGGVEIVDVDRFFLGAEPDFVG